MKNQWKRENNPPHILMVSLKSFIVSVKKSVFGQDTNKLFLIQHGLKENVNTEIKLKPQLLVEISG